MRSGDGRVRWRAGLGRGDGVLAGSGRKPVFAWDQPAETYGRKLISRPR